MKLNDEQKKAILANDRFLFLLAGAGTGKTTVIVERIKRLISEGVNPEEILAITFTRKASLEMKNRVKNENVQISTFHQFCYHNLKNELKIDFSMVKENETGKNPEVLLKISNHKNSLYRTRKPFYYRAYQRYLLTHHLKDFDDLMLDFYHHIKGKSHKYRFKHIFLDEFQDTNLLQYTLLNELITDETHVFAVGDPDQCIYSFRGTKVFIIDFFVKTTRASVYTLCMNYRSAPQIIQAANRLMKQNKSTYKKVLTATQNWKTIIQYICCKDEVEEAFQIMYFIKFFLKMRIIPHQISILFRNHFRSFSLQKILAENDIEFQLFDGDENEKIKGVQLMTIHKSKGLEFDVVIILGLEQGVLPSQRENRYSELEEERRLMFVAITRARRFLVMTSTHLSAFKTVNKPSIFIEESGVKRTPKISNDGIISLGDVREDRK